jgi:DNA-binding NarL/FixJ family response regulator
MAKIDIYLAETNCLIREGLKSIIHSVSNFNLVGEIYAAKNFHKDLLNLQPNVLILDYTNPAIQFDKLAVKLSFLPQTFILALTPLHNKGLIASALNKGVHSHILYDCDKQEIVDAISSTSKGEKFFCGKIVELLLNGTNENKIEAVISGANCDPLKLSDREIEIVRLVAEGFSAKQIADHLCLSIHTVNTHRKNIMAKLNVNNTAGLVMYAIRENIITPNKFLFSGISAS